MVVAVVAVAVVAQITYIHRIKIPPHRIVTSLHRIVISRFIPSVMRAVHDPVPRAMLDGAMRDLTVRCWHHA